MPAIEELRERARSLRAEALALLDGGVAAVIQETVGPVEIAGSVVRRASLHNMDEVERKDIRIGDLARQMVEARGLRLRGPDCPEGDIELLPIGLRPGEKLHEAPVTGARSQATAHPKIRDVPVPHLSRRETAMFLRYLDAALGQRCAARLDEIISRLQRLEGDDPASPVVQVPGGPDADIQKARNFEITPRRRSGAMASQVTRAMKESRSFAPMEKRKTSFPTQLPMPRAPAGGQTVSAEGIAGIADGA